PLVVSPLLVSARQPPGCDQHHMKSRICLDIQRECKNLHSGPEAGFALYFTPLRAGGTRVFPVRDEVLNEKSIRFSDLPVPLRCRMRERGTLRFSGPAP